MNKFINSTIYFITLAIVIAICCALLSQITSLSHDNVYTLGSAITTILCGCLILFFANKADEIAKQLGGDIDNSFGVKLQNNAKTLWGDTKNIAQNVYKKVKKK